MPRELAYLLAVSLALPACNYDWSVPNRTDGPVSDSATVDTDAADAGADGSDSDVTVADGSDDTFRLVSSEPGDTGVLARAATVVLRFSHPVDPTTISASSIRLTRGGKVHPTTLQTSADAVVVAPGGALVLGGRYILEVLGQVADTRGQTVQTNSLEVRAQDGSWGEPQKVDDAHGGRVCLDVAGSGAAGMMWFKGALGPDRMPTGQRFSADTWSAPRQLATFAVSFTDTRCAIAAGPSGNLVAAWESNDAIAVATHDGDSWADGRVIGAGYSPAVTSALTVGGRVIYRGSAESMDGVVVARGNGLQWGARILFATAQAFAVVHKIKRFGTGELAIWTSSAAPQTISARVVHADHVAPAATISGGTSTATSPDLAVEPEGQAAMAVWQQVDAFAQNVYAAYMVIGGNFSSPILVSDGTSNAGHAAVSMDERGNALVVWDQVEPVGSSIRARRFDRATGTWSSPVTVSDTASQDLARNPLVTVERGGNALVLYQEGHADGTAAAVAARYLAGEGFVAAERRALSPEAAKVESIALGSDDLGRAFAAWNAESAVWVSRFE